ncbi:MAG: FAD-dependent oxidoreductase [Pseudomonadota bacterium]
MKSHARVVVIGGGAMGVSLLYHLAKLGWRECLLVEKNELTAGSTWHAAGLCTHFGFNVTIMSLRAHSVRLYKALEAETGQPVSFHACGALRVTKREDRMAEFRHVQGLGKFAGFDFNILSPAELKAIYPLAETDDLLGAIHEPLDGYVDPSQATMAMAAGARQNGAEIARHTPVHGIERNSSGEWIVHTNKGDIRAEIVVNAAGTWCREIGEMMGLDLPVVPMLHQYLVTDRVEAFAALDRELPFIRDPDESWYLRQERDGLICGPYERGGQPWAVDGVPPDFGMELLPPELERIEEIVACAMERVPALAEAGIKTIVNGPITFTPDANPLIGPAPGLTNAYLLTGSSMGVMEGGGAGKFLAEWIVGGEPPMDALAVDPRRFGAYADRAYRVAKCGECFGNQFAIHYPYEERPAGRPGRTTAVHERLDDLGASFGFVYGWERPNWFAAEGESRDGHLTFGRANWFERVAEECARVRDAVGLADLSVFAKFEIAGPDAEAFLEGLGANRPPRRQGGIGLIHVLTPNGGVLAEFTVTRVAEDRYYLTTAAAARDLCRDLLRERSAKHGALEIRDTTEETAVLGLRGPSARDVLGGLTNEDLGFPWLTARTIEIAGLEVRALRVSYVGELGWEFHLPMNQQARLFDRLMDAGQPHGIGPFGAYAMNALRLEKGYRAWGADLTTERTPLEAGLGYLVKTEGRDFIGRDALLRRAAEDQGWHMELLALDDEGPDPFNSHSILIGDKAVGMVTSGAFCPRVGQRLALGYLKDAPEGAPLTVEVLGQAIPARVLKRPPYDPDNLRLKG